MSTVKLDPRQGGSTIYEMVMSYNEAKAVVEEVTGLTVSRIKLRDNGNGCFCIWKFPDGSYVTTPCGPSVAEEMSMKDLSYGYSEGMDTFVAFVPSSDDEEA